jgi:hypothetical protein
MTSRRRAVDRLTRCRTAGRRTLNTLAKAKSLVLTKGGSLLWVSPAWGVDEDTITKYLGSRWQEFIHQEDMPQYCGWLRYGAEGSFGGFRTMEAATGLMANYRFVMVRLADLRILIGDVCQVRCGDTCEGSECPNFTPFPENRV